MRFSYVNQDHLSEIYSWNALKWFVRELLAWNQFLKNTNILKVNRAKRSYNIYHAAG